MEGRDPFRRYRDKVTGTGVDEASGVASAVGDELPTMLRARLLILNDSTGEVRSPHLASLPRAAVEGDLIRCARLREPEGGSDDHPPHLPDLLRTGPADP